MDEFKVSFEWVFVGVLAFPFVLLLLYTASRFVERLTGANLAQSAWEFVREHSVSGREMSALTGVLLVAFVYYLGAGTARLADEYLDSNKQVFDRVILPSDDCIKVQTYREVYAQFPDLRRDPRWAGYLASHVEQFHGALIGRTDGGNQGCTSPAELRLSRCFVKPVYNFQKYSVYTRSDDGFDMLRQMESQINVLRGGAVTGLGQALLSIVYLLGSLAAAKVPRGWWLRYWFFASRFGGSQMRLMQLRKPARVRTRPGVRRIVAVLGVFGGLSCVFGAVSWADVEKEYDKSVIQLFHSLPPDAGAANVMPPVPAHAERAHSLGPGCDAPENAQARVARR